MQNDGEEFLDILRQIPTINKIDYVRYIILRDHGGIYADMDIYLKNDFKDFINPNKIYINGRGDGLCNSLMISPPNRLWELVLRESRVRIKNYFYDLKEEKEYIDGRHVNFRVDRQSFITGAMLLQDVITANNLWDKITILDEHFFNREARGNDFAYTIHYQTSMWRLPRGHRKKKTQKSFKMRNLFKNIKGERVNEVEYSLEFLSKHPGAKVYVGSDSQKKRKTVEFATVIAFRYGSRGCHLIYHKWSERRKGYGRGDEMIAKRLETEINKTMEVAIYLQENSIKVFQVDFDINSDKELNTKSSAFVQTSVGWAKGSGFQASVKPDEQVATKAANQIVNKGLLVHYN